MAQVLRLSSSSLIGFRFASSSRLRLRLSHAIMPSIRLISYSNSQQLSNNQQLSKLNSSNSRASRSATSSNFSNKNSAANRRRTPSIKSSNRLYSLRAVQSATSISNPYCSNNNNLKSDKRMEIIKHKNSNSISNQIDSSMHNNQFFKRQVPMQANKQDLKHHWPPNSS